MQTGSAEHQAARVIADRRACSSRGLTLSDQAAQTAGGVGRGRIDEELRACRRTRKGVPERGGRVSGVERELVDERVCERVDQDKPRRDLAVRLPCPSVPHALVAAVDKGSACDDVRRCVSQAQRPVENDEDPFALDLDRGPPVRIAPKSGARSACRCPEAESG